MPEARCGRCGESLSPQALAGELCPRCLLLLALGQDPDDDFTQTVESPPIGHFTVLARLGEGGAATLFLAEDRDIPGRRVALKVLKPDGPARDIEALRKEASLAALEQLRREGLPPHPYYWAGFVAAGDWR